MEISKAAAGIAVIGCIAIGAAGTFIVTDGGEETRAVVPGELQEPIAAAQETVAVPKPESTVSALTPPPAPAPVRPAPITERPRATRPAPAPARVQTPPQPEPAPLPPAENVVETPAPEPPLAQLPPLEPPVADDDGPSPLVDAEPPAALFDEVIVAKDSVIGLEVETAISSETAEVEDRVAARVTREVRVGDRVAIPVGSRVDGEVTIVDRGGRVRERARLGVQFTSLTLPDGTRVPIDTETVFRLGESPAPESAAKIGVGAIGGAIIGGILGGGKGAAIGGSAGAGAGTAAVLAGGRNHATLPAGTPVTVRVERPFTVQIAE